MDSCKILLVDDEADFLEILTKRLQRRELEVSAAPSGQEALSYLERESVDVIVLDVKMPGMDGIATLRQIKKLYPLVEVIMLTGQADVAKAIEGMEFGAFDYLMKPANFDELLYKIQDAHERKALQQAKIGRIQETLDDGQ